MLELERISPQGTGIFLMFMVGFAMITMLRYMYPVILKRDTLSLFYFTGAETDNGRDGKSDAMYEILSVFIYSYIIALFFTVWYDVNFKEEVFILKDMLYIFMWVFAYVIVRYIIDLFIGWLFSISEYTRLFVEKTIALRVSVGMYGILAFFILWYSMGGIEMNFEYKTLAIALSMYVLLYFLVMLEYLIQSVSYFLYFIFYLCIVEICPLLLVWSIIEKNLTT